MSDYSLTVDREKLLGLLRVRLADVQGFYAAKVAVDQKRLDNAQDPNKVWIVYFTEMATRVKNGTLLRDDSRPRGEKWVASPGTPPQPTLPIVEDVTALTTSIEQYKERSEIAARPYNTAIAMLEIAVGNEITIPTSEYENLLKQPTNLV